MITVLSPAKPRSPLMLHLPPSPAFPDGWSGSINEARLLQSQLAKQVSLDLPAGPFLHVAGVDAGLEDHGRVVRAAAVMLDARTLQPLEQAVARVPTTMPYVPGLLSFRELPAVLAALAQLTIVPDLVLCDGQGIAHPRRLGIAAHLGVWTGLRTIGVAKKRLCGTADEPDSTRGATAPLFDRGDQIGTLLRTRDRVAPLIVSPGHRVGLAQAPEIVLAMTTRYRLPEPTRLADRLASQRDRRPAQPDLVQR